MELVKPASPSFDIETVRAQLGDDWPAVNREIMSNLSSDVALVKSESAEELHIEMTHTESPSRCLSPDSKGSRDQRFEARQGLSPCVEILNVLVESIVG